MFPQVDDFLAESEALYELVGDLDDVRLSQETAFKEWTLNDVFAHLHVWNMAAGHSLDDDAAFADFFANFQSALSGKESLRDAEKRHIGGVQGRPLVAQWREGFQDVAARFSKADPSARVKWAGPDMSVRSSITARLMETWAHGQEVYDILGVERTNADRIKNIVILGVNTYGWTFKVRGETPPTPTPYLTLIAPSGATWAFGEENAEERIEGLAEEFCQVVTQTRNIADTNLRVTGSNATNWMSKAQCFAGPPETPPPPGMRKRADL